MNVLKKHCHGSEEKMKKVSVVLVFILFLFAGNIYGQTVLVRPGGSIGYCTADDMKGLSYTYGIKILLMANEFQRYGVKVDHLNILADDKMSYLSTGLFIEQVLFKYFNMGIGTVGYINLLEKGENPFGLYTHLGFEYNFNKWFGILAAYQTDFIFRNSFTMNNAFLLEIGIRL
jgi:hypothetical protein